MSEIDQFLAANEEYASAFEKGNLSAPPARRVAILTCMDARLDPAKFVGLQEGDAHVIRNAGGRASADGMRSLIISQQLLGTQEIVVIHHTDCGMMTFTNERIRELLQDRFRASAAEIDFLPFANLEQSVRDDIETIRSNPFIPEDIEISGFIYDVESGRLSRVV